MNVSFYDVLALCSVGLLIFLFVVYGRKANQKRDIYARSIGFEVSQVTKDILVYKDHYSDIASKKDVVVSKYSLPCNSSCCWYFRQVLPADNLNRDNRISDWYQLEESGLNKIDKSIRDILRDFSEQYDADYYEIEKDKNGLHLYWESNGGKKNIDGLYEILMKIKKSEESRG